MQKSKTNFPDLSALIPVMPEPGKRSRALYTAIRRLIETGQLPAGAKLPTTRDLARRLGLSRGAAVDAYEVLIAEGFAEARVGAGTFVAAEVPQLKADVPEIVDDGADYSGPPHPCTLGIAIADERTRRVFRQLLHRRLERPQPNFYSYGDPRGEHELRQAIADYARVARGVRCHPGQVVVTSGIRHGLDLVMRAALHPGDAVWVEDPCYLSAQATITGVGLRTVPVPVDREGIDVAAGEVIGGKAKAVYCTPSHQFPLGVTLTMRRRLALIDWAKRNDAWIFEDDYDSEFRFSGPPLASIQGMDDAGRVIYLGSFSKVLFPGLRIGYAILPEPLVEPVLAQRQQMDRQPPSLPQGAIADLLNEGHFAAHLRRVRKRAEACRDALVDGLGAGGNSFSVAAPEQGLHLIVSLADEFDDEKLVTAAAEAGIGALPLSTHYLAAPIRKGLVLGYSGFEPEDLRRAGKKLAGIVHDLSPATADGP
ncbi:PLP-dependent aminotransferase family protein [Ensifer sp. BR816]|uniref:MocR-like pyridoxine biosynthesis transcription factor PdxR n=1 Tax=Rhizobium sp. (strain BR816) TaxID=1057002 RepID=UPI0003723BEF|nr:PLP-dependent aminotransferase family protein [Ensifer sp. BR816]